MARARRQLEIYGPKRWAAAYVAGQRQRTRVRLARGHRRQQRAHKRSLFCKPRKCCKSAASDNAGAFKLESTTGAGAVTFGSSGVGTLKVLFIHAPTPPFADEGTITMIGCDGGWLGAHALSRGRRSASVGSQGVAVYGTGGTSQGRRALGFCCRQAGCATQIGGISMSVSRQHVW